MVIAHDGVCSSVVLGRIKDRKDYQCCRYLVILGRVTRNDVTGAWDGIVGCGARWCVTGEISDLGLGVMGA
jgi:hypothetical protein